MVCAHSSRIAALRPVRRRRHGLETRDTKTRNQPTDARGAGACASSNTQNEATEPARPAPGAHRRAGGGLAGKVLGRV
jgi:hypothetical protein